MERLIKLEWAKVSTYNFFRAILIITLVLFLLVTFVLSRIDITVPGFSWKNIFRFPNIWHTLTWIASWFNVLLAIMVMVITGNEFTTRSFRQQVMTGLSRNEWLIGKGILVVGLSLLVVVMVFISGVVFGLIFSKDYSIATVFSESSAMFVYFVQSLGYMTLALLFISLLRSNALAIILYLLYFIFIEPITRLLCPVEVRPWFPVKIISHLTPVPEFLQLASQNDAANTSNLSLEQMGLIAKQLPDSVNLLMAIVYILVFATLTWLIVKKRDL